MGRRWWSLLVVMALGALPLGADWDAARAALDAGDAERAAAEAEAVLAGQPDFAPGHHLLGMARQQLGLTAAASASLARAVELAPSEAGYRLALARLQLQTDQADAALATLTPVDLATVPVDLQGAVAQLLAAAATRSDRAAAAVPALEAVVAAFPDDAFLWLTLGEARSAAGDEVGAFEAYGEAAAREETEATAARAAARSAIRIANTLAEAADRGLWYGWAAELAERAAGISGAAEDAVLAGDAHLGAGEAGRARTWLERAVAGGGGELALYLLGRALTGDGQPQRAVERLSEVLGRSEEAALRRLTGYALVQLHEQERGFDAAEQVAVGLGDPVRAAQARGLAAALAANDPRFEPCFERWVALQWARENARRHEGTAAWTALEARQTELLAECGDPLGLGQP